MIFNVQYALGRPTWVIVMNCGMLGNMADVITHAKFYIIGSGVWGCVFSDTPNLHFSIGLAGRSYDCVSTAVLHCDVQFLT